MNQIENDFTIGEVIKLNPDFPRRTDIENIYGAYIILHCKTGKIYIGSGQVYHRKRNHTNKLKRGIHSNEELQKAFNNDSNIQFNIIQRTNTSNEAYEIEQYFLDKYFHSGLLFNKYSNAKSPLGIKLSDEVKRNLSIAASMRIGNKNPFYGKQHSEETKRKLSEIFKERNAVPTNARKVLINEIKYDSLARAAKATGLSTELLRYRVSSKKDKYSNYKYLS